MSDRLAIGDSFNVLCIAVAQVILICKRSPITIVVVAVWSTLEFASSGFRLEFFVIFKDHVSDFLVFVAIIIIAMVTIVGLRSNAATTKTSARIVAQRGSRLGAANVICELIKHCV